MEIPTKAYHYTSHSAWMIMGSSGWGRKGLQPTDNGALGQPVVYAFSSPEPKEWTQNKEFPHIWQSIMTHAKHGDILQMRISWTIEEKDDANVVDWIHMERVRDAAKRVSFGGETKEDRKKIRIAEELYRQSQIPLNHYSGNYSLPELVVKNPISLDRLSIEEIF